MLIAARNGFMTGKSPPYDAEVEWVKSDGVSYVNMADNLTRFAGLMYDEVRGTAVCEFDAVEGNEGQECVVALGVYTFIVRIPTSYRFRVRIGGRSCSVTKDVAPSGVTVRAVGILRESTTTLHCTASELNPDFDDGDLDFGTSQYGNVADLSGARCAPLKILAAGHINGNGEWSDTTQIANYSRFRRFTFYSSSGRLLMDAYPVRVGDVCYIYDAANLHGGPLGNGLFPPADGVLVFGPDKQPTTEQ